VTSYGYFLSCEEYDPADLVRPARQAGQAGFDSLWISDHFHPWLAFFEFFAEQVLPRAREN
jgi:alkanesulfonate monooxygenase SsuD/methylene tetrahydromethanopterin reductase-like flavin-dependent oxidoreductase (luciferase family)